MILTLFTAMITLLTAPADMAAQASPAQLTGIGYSVKDGRSLLSLRCTTPVPPQVEELGRKVVLHFTGMTVAPRPGEASVPFADGDIASMSIRKEGSNGLRVVVDLRAPGVQYTVTPGSPGSPGSILFVATSSRKNPADGLTAGGARSLAGLVEAPVTSAMHPAPSVGTKTTHDDASGLSIPAMMLAILVSALSTATVLFVLRNKTLRPAVQARRVAPAVSPVEDAPADEMPAWGESEEETEEEAEESSRISWQAEMSPAAEPEEELPQEYADAMSFRRMRAEVGLARTMNGAVVSRRKAEELRSLAGGVGNPEVLKTARRLGVGRGEIALATRLSLLRTPAPASEPAPAEEEVQP